MGRFSIRMECKEKCQGVALTFNGRRGVPLTVSMATSFTGREGAEKNLTAEVFPFESMMWRNIHEWIARLHTIDVEDPDTARVNQFYGALYRASFLPREMSDVDGSYPRFGLTQQTYPQPLPIGRGVDSPSADLSANRGDYSPP